MDNEQEYNPDLITVQDDEGNEHIFEELDRIETDQGRYVAMLPTFDSEEEMLESDSELIILKVFEEGDETFLAAIEDDDELEAMYSLIMDELYAEEDEEDEIYGLEDVDDYDGSYSGEDEID